MMSFYKITGIDIKSLKLLRELYLEMEGRGMFINEMTIVVNSFSSKRKEFITVKNYQEFKNTLNKFLIDAKDSIGTKAAIIQDFYLINKNLDRYSNEFYVDARTLTAPKFRDIKLKENQQQIVINREVDRYKKFIASILNNYRVAYAIQIQIIIDDLTNNNQNSYANYVDPDYVLPVYVTPQQ